MSISDPSEPASVEARTPMPLTAKLAIAFALLVALSIVISLAIPIAQAFRPVELSPPPATATTQPRP